MLSVLSSLPKAQWVLTTMGTKGSALLKRAPPGQMHNEAVVLDALLEQLFEKVTADGSSNGNGAGGDVACVSSNGVQIRYSLSFAFALLVFNG